MGTEPTRTIKTGPFAGYSVSFDPQNNSERLNVFVDGPFQGEALSLCDAQRGFYIVPGDDFSKEDFAFFRKFLQVDTSWIFLNDRFLKEPPLLNKKKSVASFCILANQREWNRWAIDRLKSDECYSHSEQKCDRVISTLQRAMGIKTNKEKGMDAIWTAGTFGPLLGTMIGIPTLIYAVASRSKTIEASAEMGFLAKHMAKIGITAVALSALTFGIMIGFALSE